MIAEPQDRPPLRTYRQAEARLMRFVNYEVKPPPSSADAAGWRLQAFARLLEELGRPQAHCPIIHVAGTKGKGSTTRLIAGILTAAGWRNVGAFTSPHIDSFRERISVDGRPLSEAAFVRALGEALRAGQAGPDEGFRTTFETLTAMAFLHFRERDSEAVVLETGLGGRLDCTNAAQSLVALVTAVGFDHQQVLGRTLGEIAAEKAGIVKEGTRVALVAPQVRRRMPVVRAAVERAARRANAEVEVFSKRRDPVPRAEADDRGWQLDVVWGAETLRDVRLPVFGAHQVDNVRGALMTVRRFAGLLERNVEPDAVRRALESFEAPGRLEVARAADPLVLVDAAHCPLSMRGAAAALRLHFPNRPAMIVVGLLRDKNPDAVMLSLRLEESVQRIFTYTPDSPRALDGARLAEAARRRNLTNVKSCVSLEEALAEAMRAARPEKGLVLVAGTTYGVGPARALLARS